MAKGWCLRKTEFRYGEFRYSRWEASSKSPFILFQWKALAALSPHLDQVGLRRSTKGECADLLEDNFHVDTAGNPPGAGFLYSHSFIFPLGSQMNYIILTCKHPPQSCFTPFLLHSSDCFLLVYQDFMESPSDSLICPVCYRCP